MFFLFFLNMLLGVQYCSASHDFAFDLYKNLKANPETTEKNIFFSPYSIKMAMEVAYEGARGTTAQELARILHFNTNTQARRAESKKFIELLNKSQNAYTLLTANALWIEQSFKILPRYQKIARDWYNASINNVDFKNAPQKAEEKINACVQEQTRDMIKTILTPNALNPLTRLVITNAIYFKGTWAEPFESKETKDENFFVSETITKKVPMMHATKEYTYAQTDFGQILELDYAGDDLSMIILLPKDKNLDALEGQLTPENFEEWKLGLMKQKVHIAIPRIKLDTSYGLVETFKQMGIHQAFNPSTTKSGADFSGIDGKRDLYIALINHKAALEVNEEGTTAAAATAVVIMMKSMMPRPIPEFRADHPFIMILQEKTTGTILFMGRIVSPAA